MSERGTMTPEEALRSAQATAEGWRTTCHERDKEIARLRAEVGRLTKTVERTAEAYTLARREREAARAQVAVLAQKAQAAPLQPLPRSR